MAAPDIDQLFQLPLGEFTAARNTLAATLKAAGHADQAATVKAMPKPSLSAWTVNQLYWRHRQAFDRFMTIGEQLRKAQAAQFAGKGGDMRASLDAHRTILGELNRLALSVLRAEDHAQTPDLTRRITTTLEALAAYGRQATAPSAGRLTRDVDPPGFEALAALVPRGGARTQVDGPSRVIPFRHPAPTAPPKKLDAAGKTRQKEEAQKAQRAAAVAGLRDGERALRDARKAAAQAESALRRTAVRTRAAEKRKTALTKALEMATTEATDARQHARRVAAAAEEAAQAVTDAERAVAQARRTLETLS